MKRGTITKAERRHRDYLRQNGLRVASVYGERLAAARRKELRRVLAQAKDYTDEAALIPLLQGLDETGYLPKWWVGLYQQAGLPHARATARALKEAKAAEEEEIWLATLRRYAEDRAGNEIRVVSGTWRDSLIRLTRSIMAEQLGMGIEKLTRRIYDYYTGNLEKWQIRRIAQTEAMIGMAEAGAEAARTLDVPFTKQWAISGLGNTRESHEAMDGIIVDEDEPFVLEGGLMMYPHDTSMGADASEIINCACDVLRRPKPYGSAVQDTPAEPAQEPASEVTPAEPGTPPPAPAVSLTPEQAALEARVAEIIAEMPDRIPEAARRAIALNCIDLEKPYNLGIARGKAMTIAAADKQSANPKFVKEFIVDPKGDYVDKDGLHYRKNPKYRDTNRPYHINCATCVPTFILRLRGFRVTALPKLPGKTTELASRNQTFNMWKNADGTRAKPILTTDWMKSKGYKQMSEARYREWLEESCKEEGLYAITVTWKGKRSAHATIIQRDAKGKLWNIEPQEYIKEKGMRRSINGICKGGTVSPDSLKGIMRVDDKVFDPLWTGLFDK